jgi:hypothetical protein
MPSGCTRIAIAVSPDNANYVYLFGGPPTAVGSFKGFYLSTNSGGSFSTTSAVFVPVAVGSPAATAQIGPFDLSQTNRRLVVHASLFGRMVTAGEVLEVELAQSSDNITYTSIAWTLRALRARVGNTPLAQADIEQSFTIATRIVSISATTYIRLRARTSGGATGTINCVSLFGELYNK